MKIEKISLYKDRQDVTLTTYIIDDSKEMLDGKERPAILICPGGGYLGLSDREAEPIALKYASLGYHAFILHYSVYRYNHEKEDPTLGNIERREHCGYPKPILEMGMAILKIRENAKKWLVDMDKIILCGFSAGGHNVAMYGNLWHSAFVTDSLGVTAESIRPAAMILSYAVTDYDLLDSLQTDEGIKEYMKISRFAYMGSAELEEIQIDAISPARHVNEKTPPTFLWATAQDSLVPVQNTLVMAKALADKKIPFEVHIFPNGEHGLALGTWFCAAKEKQINETVATWPEMTAKWLKSIGMTL